MSNQNTIERALLPALDSASGTGTPAAPEAANSPERDAVIGSAIFGPSDTSGDRRPARRAIQHDAKYGTTKDWAPHFFDYWTIKSAGTMR